MVSVTMSVPKLFLFLILVMKCKHVLAVKLASRLGRCIERNVTEDGLIETSVIDVD